MTSRFFQGATAIVLGYDLEVSELLILKCRLLLSTTLSVIPFTMLHSLSGYYPWERCEPLYFSRCGLNSITSFLFKDGFGIKEPMKIDMPLKKKKKKITRNRTLSSRVLTWCINANSYVQDFSVEMLVITCYSCHIVCKLSGSVPGAAFHPKKHLKGLKAGFIA